MELKGNKKDLIDTLMLRLMILYQIKNQKSLKYMLSSVLNTFSAPLISKKQIYPALIPEEELPVDNQLHTFEFSLSSISHFAVHLLSQWVRCCFHRNRWIDLQIQIPEHYINRQDVCCDLLVHHLKGHTLKHNELFKFRHGVIYKFF